MAYLKPSWFTVKVFNPFAATIGMGETLTVTRRHSGRPQQLPVIPVDVAGSKYVVSTRGESEWVKNLRANPNAKIGDTEYVAREIPRPTVSGSSLPIGRRPADRSRATSASCRARPTTRFSC